MRFDDYKPALFALLFFFFLVPRASAQAKHKNQDGREKSVWSYDGGVFFETDGSLPNGICFRIHGHMGSDDFFDGLKRIDTDQATIFRRGTEAATKFPDTVTVSFPIPNLLC